jgi:hypothetical protein
MNWKDFADVRWKDLRRLKRDDVLHRLGLEEHTPTTDFFTGMGLFAVGVAVGAGLGILFAPKPGAEIRGRLTDTLRNRGSRMEEVEQRMESAQPGSHHIS